MAALHPRSAGGGLRIGRHDARDARRAPGRRRRSGRSRLRALGMPPAMTSLRVLLLVTLGVLPIQPAGAQGTQPLRKAELVRMLARRALSKPQIATLVRRNCVTFQPTAHDRAELRAAGADDAERAGATTITARVGTLTRTVLVRADPGPPEALVVERGDTPVVGSLTLRSRDTVVLRVVARDRYGN